MLRKDKKNLKEGTFLSDYSTDLFINKEGKIIYPDELTFIGAGENSSVWKYKNDALKIFFEDRLKWALAYDSYTRIKNLSMNRIIKAKDSFYECNTSYINHYKLDAYLMDYIEKINKINILEIPTSLLLKNIYLLEEDTELLSKNCIKMRDIKIENSIINSNYELFFSDIDMYECIFSSNTENILLENKIELNFFFKKYIAKSLEKLVAVNELTSEEYNMLVFKLYNTLTSFKVEKQSIYHSYEKLFGNYEMPKEYFLSYKK